LNIIIGVPVAGAGESGAAFALYNLLKMVMILNWRY